MQLYFKSDPGRSYDILRNIKILLQPVPRTLFFLLIFFAASTRIANGQCTNADFSSGDFTGWTGTYGNSYMLGTCLYSYPWQFNGLLQGPMNSPSNTAAAEYCQVITSTAGGNEPFLAANGINIPVTYPGGSGYSARIGNTWPNTGRNGNNSTPDAESLTYSFAVTPANAGFTYYYFAILNVGSGHTAAQQPYFHIFLVNSAGDTVNCASFNVDATSAAIVGGFDSVVDQSGLAAGTVFYKPWTPVYIPLTSYIGQTVSITFVTRSCNPVQGGCPNGKAGIHFAIAYIGGECSSVPLTLTAGPNNTCAANGYTITAPVGARSYSWSGPGITANNNQSIWATQTGLYTVTMTTYGANPCTYTLDTTLIVPVYIAPSAGPDQTICQYTTATMNATRTGTWTIMTGNPVATTIANTSDPATVISGFTVPGRYNYIWTTTTGCTDTMSVVVTAKPNAGQDQTTCQYSTATMAATGTGTWSGAAGNPASVTFASPTSPSSSVSGFTVPGTYVMLWTKNGCSDTANVVVTPKPNAGPDQSTCPYYSVTMAAVGVGTWTKSPANPAVTTITNLTSPTTTVTGFSAVGAYAYYWTVNGCVDTVIITVNAKPNAGIDQTTCQYSTATMAASGTGTWSAAAGNPAVVTFANPTSPVSSVSGFTAAGTYMMLWSNNGCPDTALVTVIAKPNAGPDQNICQFYPVTMAATGTGTWTTLSTNPAATVITSPASPTTGISGFTVPGAYGFIWTVNGCTDTVTINVNTKPNAGPDQTTCQYSTATMAAVGTGTWLAAPTNPATVTFTTPASPTTSVSGFALPGVYTLFWSNVGCNDTALVTVIAKPNAGADQSICQYTTATMAATGTGTWTALSANPAATVISNSSLPTTTISGFNISGTYGYIWTANGCTDTANVIVTAKPNAGPDQVTCQYSTATMAATGIGTWTALSANPAVTTIITPASPTTVISGFPVPGVYSYVWTVNGCTDTMNVSVTVKPNAGLDQTTCQYSTATLTAIGAGTWTLLSANPAVANITTPSAASTGTSGFSLAGTYGFIWTVNGCTDTADVIAIAKPDAGPDLTTCQYSTATMAATGVGTWTALPTNPLITNIAAPSSPTTIISGYNVPGEYSYVWTVNGCTDTINVSVTVKPDAGVDMSFCMPGITTINAVSGPGVWTADVSNPGTSTIVSPTSTSTVISNTSVGGYYNYIWTVNGCTDTMMVTAYPTLPSGPNQTTCQYSSIGTAAFGHGTWIPLSTNPSLAVIGDIHADTTTISGFNLPGIYGFIWSVSPCTDTMYVTVVPKPDAGIDQTICQFNTVTLGATGAGTWTADPTNPFTVVFANANDPVTTATGFNNYGIYTLYWSLNGCSDTVLINVKPKPDAGPDLTTCQYSTATLAGIAASGSIWTAELSNPDLVTIADNTSPTSVVSGFMIPGSYAFYWTLNGCPDTALIDVTPKPNAGPDQNICQRTTATMAGIGGAGMWTALSSNLSVATITTPTSSNTTITGLDSVGTYGFIWTVNGCTDTMNVIVHIQPTVFLGDTAICLNQSATLVPLVSPTGGTYLWNTTATTPTITVAPADTTAYTLAYTFGICTTTVTDTVIINPLPTATVTTIASVCTAGNGIAIVHPAAGIPGYTYSWSAPGGTADSLIGVIPGQYSVTVTDINQCTVSATNTVPHQTPAIIVSEVSQHNLKCFNDATGDIYISTTDTARNSGAYIYAYIWSGAAGTTQNLTNVQAGGYTVTVSDQFGCTGTASYTLTQPQPITATTPITNPHCFGYTNGVAGVTPSGGSGAYHYAWSTTPAQTTQQAINLGAGIYTVSVTDDSACLAIFIDTLVDPQAITFASPIITNASCPNVSNGKILAVPQNGIGSYTFLWSNGKTDNPDTALAIGTYTVTATDSNGCFASATATVVPLTQLLVSIASVNVTCFGLNTGSATATASAGTPTYSYQWNNNAKTATISNLSLGTYTVSATDNNGCTASNAVVITQPDQLMETPTPIRTSCPSSIDGAIIDSGSGGTGPYSYTLEDTANNILQTNTTGSFAGLSYGPYTLVITDQHNCQTTEIVNVPQAPFNYYTDTAISTSCYGVSYTDGMIHIEGFTIANGPFLYSLDGGAYQYTPDFFGLAAGTHTMAVKDNYDCDTTFNITVPEALPALLQILPGDSTITPGSSIQLSTVFTPYGAGTIKTYAWTPGDGLSCIDCPSPVASPYNAQTLYTLVVTYNEGCLDTAFIEINTNGVPPVYIPNAFTPNGNGTNDVWFVYGTGIKDFRAMIFNRWGEKVFESNDQFIGWDGTYRGEAQPPGVYVYQVDIVYLNGEKKFRNGGLTLIR